MPTYMEYIEVIKLLWDSHWPTNRERYYENWKIKRLFRQCLIVFDGKWHMTLELTKLRIHGKSLKIESADMNIVTLIFLF